jgi:hypothetical protein
MRTRAHAIRSVVAAAMAAGALAVAPAATAVPSGTVVAARSCPITMWGHTGYYNCDPYFKNGYLDWDENRTVDEVFVVAPNRTIWHTWASAGGWKEMPGNGRADRVYGPVETGNPYRRCIIVFVDNASYHYWQNCFYSGRWHTWTTSG